MVVTASTRLLSNYPSFRHEPSAASSINQIFGHVLRVDDVGMVEERRERMVSLGRRRPLRGRQTHSPST